MSGITGFIDPSCSLNASELQGRVSGMADSIRQRGPDDSGDWVDEKTGLALGFRRLATLDLSPAGHQPMLSVDGRYVIIFDGEIYNHAELGAQLGSSGQTNGGRSDAGVILAGFCRWGVIPALEHLNGMFAMAVWDRLEGHLLLVRDRMGIKPLYYGWCGGVFLFGSELKALRKHPAFDAQVDADTLALLLRYGYIPSPYTIYRGIRKLMPGTVMEIRPGEPVPASQPQPFWSARTAAVQGVLNPFAGSETDAIDELDALLRDSISLRMQADVPVGAFLSGGIDSSTIVAQMQAQSSRPVKTFSIGFSEAGFNEAAHARAVADHLHTEHSEWMVTANDALNVIPQLPEIYDEPFADSSQIPTFLVSSLARRHVAVSLSGDGGDEPFAGYTRYPGCARLWHTTSRIPRPLRLLAKGVLDGLAGAGVNHDRAPAWYQKALRDRRLLSARSPQALYHSFISLWDDPTGALTRGIELLTNFTDPTRWPPELDFDHWMMYLDHFTLNPEDVLVKTDRAGMAVSLEIRAPLLDDHRLVEFAWRIPLNMKIRDGRGKWLLRQVLYRYVPPALVDRPKQGFMIPMAAWLRGPLRPWAESQLDEKRLAREGFFNPAVIRKKWLHLLEKETPAPGDLWAVLMFQSWLEHTCG
jgi:asparagine synthase (glutamine-hydrolysing)